MTCRSGASSTCHAFLDCAWQGTTGKSGINDNVKIVKKYGEEPGSRTRAITALRQERNFSKKKRLGDMLLPSPTLLEVMTPMVCYLSLRTTVYSSRFKFRTTATFAVNGWTTGEGDITTGGGRTGSICRATASPRSFSVTRRAGSIVDSAGRRKMSESLPIFVASRTFCACSDVTSIVTALATVGCSCCSLAS